MRSAVVLFPGSNRDHDMVKALHSVTGIQPTVVWHQDATLPDVDLIVLPGGFSYGDYLRCGAIARLSPWDRAPHTRPRAYRQIPRQRPRAQTRHAPVPGLPQRARWQPR